MKNPLSFIGQLSERGDLAVPLVSIYRYVETAGLEKLDFVKIDVEGAEDSVIRGMTRTLQTFRPVVLVEVHTNDGRENEALGRLQAAGYQLKRVQSNGLPPCDTRTRRGHVLEWWHA